MNDMDTSFYPKAGEGTIDFNQLMQMLPGDYNQLMPMEQGPVGMELADANGEPTSKGMQAFQFFLKKGWSPVAAASIVGRLQQESGKNFNQLRGDHDKSGNPTAFGIGQWRGPRLQTLRAMARERGTSIDNFMTGLEHTHWELTEGPEANWGAKLREAKDIREGLGYMYSAWRPAASREVEVAKSAQHAVPLLKSADVVIDPTAGPPPAVMPPLEPVVDVDRLPNNLSPQGMPQRPMGGGVSMAGTMPPANALMAGPGSPGAPWFGSKNPSNKVIPKGQNLLHPNIGYGN
jgi:hypothetical protein